MVGSNSKMARIFDYGMVRDSPEEIYNLEPILTKDNIHDASIYCADFTHDGALLASGSNDKMVKGWFEQK